jgi:hypothetical protein
MHLAAVLLLLLAGVACIPHAECSLDDESTVSAMATGVESAREPWWSSVERCSVQCLQLQQKSQLHDVTYSEELVPVIWALLLAGAFICLSVSVAGNVWQMQHRRAEKAQFEVKKQELQACCRGIKAQAADLGSRAVVAAMQSQAMAKQLALLSAELQAKAVGQQLQQQGQVRSGIVTTAQPAATCLTCYVTPWQPSLHKQAAVVFLPAAATQPCTTLLQPTPWWSAS